jgi:type IV secretory pathway VirB4 component
MPPAPKTHRAPYRSTTRHAQSIYPFIADAPLDASGAVIGRDALGRVFRFDPFQLYQASRLHGPNMLVLGDIGYGKSSLIKLYLFRQALFGYVPLVTDLKGEYDRLCEALEVTPIRFLSGGHLRLNPLDPTVAGTSRLALLRSIAELLLRRSLRPREDAALEQVYSPLEHSTTPRRGQPTVGAVITRLLRPDQRGAATLETSQEELTEWGRDLAFALRRLVTGDLAGLFDEPTSPGLSLDGPMVSINLSQIPDQAKPILMACVATWLRGVWTRSDGTRRIVVQEEAWHLLASPSVAELQQANFKLARQYGVQNILVMHHLGDLRAAGDAGTRTAELATGLLADTATRVLYHLDQGEVRASAELLGLNQAQRQVIPRLQRGSGLWLVGQRAYVVHHLLAPSPDSPEGWIVDTDQAMLGANPATTRGSVHIATPPDAEAAR